MALSQIQCLDDNHVNPRTNESKPDFLYCEDQRLALEALLHDGREAFFKYLEARRLRGFLSDPELEALSGAVEPYDPGSVLFPGNVEDDEPPLSLHYWPELSDTSVPHMDLGWPDSDAYRGVTRTTMYAQPPLEGQAHIKEIVRKMIAQAQKVIAVVMDVFTDVDIFRDLLDAGFKRRVSVYILLERTTLPHFLSMCQRANMHAGHLKHLRVRCTEGVEFYTRSCSKVRGRMGHRFMFIDGDKAVSGSYSFTWMSSRLERNLITVVTGQAVDAFDRLFRFLYATSSSVDIRQVATEPEPELEPLPQPATVAPPSAALARKLYNPKYALVTLGNHSPSPTLSAGEKIPKETKNPEVLETKKRRRRRGSKDVVKEAPPIHPGLTNLEKACLMAYLPTWPEPDPPSDVIGFINIRDSSKPTQVHLQRSEMFETSQAIRFSSPFSMPKETLPEVAKPRQLTAKHEEMSKLQPAQEAEEAVVDGAQPTQLNAGAGDVSNKAEAPEKNTPASGPKLDSDKDTTKTLNNENTLHSNTPTNQDAGHNTTPHLNAHAPPQTSSKASSPTTGRPSHTAPSVTTNSPKPASPPGPNMEKEAETTLNTQSAVVYSTRTAQPPGPTDSNSNTEQQTQTEAVPPHTDSHTQAVQPQNSSEVAPKIQMPTVNSYLSSSSTSAMRSQSVSSTCLSENNNVSITTNTTTSACAPLSSISSLSSPPLTSSSTTLNPPLPSPSASPSLTSTPPIPKPRTIQLVIKDGVTSNGLKLPEFSVVTRPGTSTGPLVVHSEPAVATAVQTSPEKETESVPELQNNSGSKTGAQKAAEITGHIGEAPQQQQQQQQQQSGTSLETKNEEAVGLHDDVVSGNNTEVQSDVLITDAPKEESVIIHEIIPNDVEPETLTSVDCKLTPLTDCVATVRTETKAPERALTGCEFVPNENSTNATPCKTYRARENELQRISYCELPPHDIGVLETVDPSKAPACTLASATHSKHVSKDSVGDSVHASAADTSGQQGNASFTPARCADSAPNTAIHDTHGTFPEQIKLKAQECTDTPEKCLRLHPSNAHTPDLLSPAPERESQPLAALMRTPPTDGFPPCAPTADSRTHTPGTRSLTPDLRTPTPVSDGYVSPLSTTSEEYYECSDSPFHEPAVDRVAHCNHGKTEYRVSLAHTNTPNATTVTTSHACTNYNNRAATLGTADRNTPSSETQSLSEPAIVSSSASLLEKKVKMGEEGGPANEENGREVDEEVRNPSVAERRTEKDSQGTERRGSEDAKRTADHFKQGKDLTEIVDKNKEAQAPKRKRVLNQSAAERPVDKVTPGELTNEGSEPKRLSTGDLKPKKVSSEGERPDKKKAGDRAALGPSGVESRLRPQSTNETEGQKRLHIPPRPPRTQKQDSGASSTSRPPRPPQPLSSSQSLGARPWGSCRLNQAESKALHGSFQVLGNTSSPRRLPSRPPPPVTAFSVRSAAGQKMDEVSRSQRSLLSRQPLTVQGRTRAGQSLNQHPFPKPQASFLHTHSNLQQQLHPHSQSQTASAMEAHCQEEGRAPFSITYRRIYSLKGLKDKMSKLPAQSKRSSASSLVQGRRSMS